MSAVTAVRQMLSAFDEVKHVELAGNSVIVTIELRQACSVIYEYVQRADDMLKARHGCNIVIAPVSDEHMGFNDSFEKPPVPIRWTVKSSAGYPHRD